MNKIITIGREFGSGGRELGKRLAEKLGIAYYDQEIIEEIANKTVLSEQYIHCIVEKRPIISFPIHTGRTLHVIANPLFEQSKLVFKKQCEIIREMAEKSDCVIVGRCADYILRNNHPFRIFVYADMESKIARCRTNETEHETLTDKELKKRIAEIDKQRARYYEFYSGQTWGARINYDLCINTTNFTIREISEAMARLVSEQE